MLLVWTIIATLLCDLMIYCCLAPIQCYYLTYSLLLFLFLKEIFELAGWRFYYSKQFNNTTSIILELLIIPSAIPPFRHSVCHYAIPPFRHSAIPPFCQSANPPFCHSAILPFHHSAGKTQLNHRKDPYSAVRIRKLIPCITDTIRVHRMPL